MRIQMLWSLLLALVCCPTWGRTSVESEASFSGRWVEVSEGERIAMKTIRQGDAFRFSLSGSAAVSARFSAPAATLAPVVTVYVDGRRRGQRKIRSQAPVELVAGLDPSQTYRVEVRVAGLHEHDAKWRGDAGLVVHQIIPRGGLARPWPDGRPGMLLIGDSITEGVAARGTPGVSSPANSVGDESFGRLAAEGLGLRAVLNGFGGSGAMVGGSGGVPPAIENAFRFNAAGPLRSHREDLEIVVVNLGTNDPQAVEHVPAFAAAYARLLSNVIGTFQPRRVYAMRPFNGAHALSVKSTAERAGAVFIDTTGWLSPEDFFDGTHPTAAGHRKAALLLTAFIARDRAKN